MRWVGSIFHATHTNLSLPAGKGKVYPRVMSKSENTPERNKGGRCLELRTFTSMEAENRAEDERRARMSVAERLQEFAAIQERVFGTAWTLTPMQKTLVSEKRQE